VLKSNGIRTQQPVLAGHVSRNAILAALKELADSCDDGSRALFYFSGHGVRLGDELYLVPSDAYHPEDPDALISFSKVLDTLNRSPAAVKLILLDACHSGPFVGQVKGRRADMILTGAFLTQFLEASRGVAVMSSSRSDETSSTKSPGKAGLSLFTHYLVEALLQPVVDQAGQMTIQAVYDFVALRVAGTARTQSRRQHPVIHLTASGPIVLGCFDKGSARPARRFGRRAVALGMVCAAAAITVLVVATSKTRMIALESHSPDIRSALAFRSVGSVRELSTLPQSIGSASGSSTAELAAGRGGAAPQYVEGGSLFRVAATKSPPEARLRIHQLRILLKGTTWLPHIVAHPRQATGTARRPVKFAVDVQDVQPAAGRALCAWLMANEWNPGAMPCELRP